MTRATGAELRKAASTFRKELERGQTPTLDRAGVSYTPLASQLLKVLARALLGTLFSEQIGKCGGGPGGCALANVLPFDAQQRRGGLDWPPVGHTMVGEQRLQNVRDSLEMVVQLGVPGDFAELGVWRGGVCIYARALLNLMCEGSRDVLVFDAFENIPGYADLTQFLSVPEAHVRGAFDKYGVGLAGVHFFKGLFKDSLRSFRDARVAAVSGPGGSPKPIAVLRIDGNFYDSYQDALYYMYDLVPIGGVVIFDDWTHQTCRDAWADFQRDQGFSQEITKIDSVGAFFIKIANVTVDHTKRHPPRDANIENI